MECKDGFITGMPKVSGEEVKHQEAQLAQLFAGSGAIKVSVIPDKGYGFVEFTSPTDLRAAIQKYNGVLFQEERLRLIISRSSGAKR